jgi:hypothetical protein
MRYLYRKIILTDKYPHVTILGIYYNQRFLERYILKPNKGIDAVTRGRLLREYFPAISFFDIEKGVDHYIDNYIGQKQGKWTLDIAKMSKSKNKNYACLFPQKISHWDEDKARSKYGSADVIKFYLYEQNETFFSKISRIKDRPARFDKKPIPDIFLADINYDNGIDVWESWDFEHIVVHKMRHDPPSIYEAFTYYARRQYNLVGFALNDASYNENDPFNNDISYLIKKGENIANSAVEECYPDTKKLNNEKWIIFFLLKQNTLEGVPRDVKTDVPRELEKFIEQLKNWEIEIKNKNKYIKNENEIVFIPYSKSNKRTLNNLFTKIAPFLDDSEKQKLSEKKTDRAKIELLLDQFIMHPSIKEIYSKQEIDSIYELFLKKDDSFSMDEEIKNDKDDNKFGNRPNQIEDEKYHSTEDISITSYSLRLVLLEFENEFKHEFGKEKLGLFLKCLPKHFEEHPNHFDSDKNLIIMSKYSKEELFKIYCSVAGRPTEDELWKQFLVMMNRVMDNINRIKKELEE